MKMISLVLLGALAVGCSGNKSGPPMRDLRMVSAPRCAEGSTFVVPLAVYAKQGSLEVFSSYTGQAGEVPVKIHDKKEKVTLKFGICANPFSANYTCAAHNHDGITYYGETEISVDPADATTFRIEFVGPKTEAPLKCTDGKPAKI